MNSTLRSSTCTRPMPQMGTWRTPAALALALALALPSGALLAPSGARAQAAPLVPPADDYETTRAMGMGLGARASAASTSALGSNPANLALGRLYHVETVVGYVPQHTNFSFGAGILDSFSAPVALGVQYRYVLGNGQYGISGMDGRAGLAYAFSEAFSIGVAGRYHSFAREGQQEGDTRGPHAEGVNVDVSLRLTPIPGLHIAAIGQNLIEYGTPYVARLAGGSLSYTFENVFTIAIDGFADLSTFRDASNNIRPEMLIGGAAEVFTGEVPIRAGYFYDSGRGIHYVTAGVGYVRPEFGVDIGWRQQVAGDDDPWLTLSFRYFVH